MTADDKRPRRRRLSAVEHELWRGVTRSVAPLKRRPRKLLVDAVEPAAAERNGKPVPVKRVQATPLRGTAAPKSAPPVPPPLMPPNRIIGRRLPLRLPGVAFLPSLVVEEEDEEEDEAAVSSGFS